MLGNWGPKWAPACRFLVVKTALKVLIFVWLVTIAGIGGSPNNDDVHQFINLYYEEAIFKIRESLPWDFPVVLFSWTYDFWRWDNICKINKIPYFVLDGGISISHMTNMAPLFGTLISTLQALTTWMRSLASTRAISERLETSKPDREHQSLWESLHSQIWSKPDLLTVALVTKECKISKNGP